MKKQKKLMRFFPFLKRNWIPTFFFIFFSVSAWGQSPYTVEVNIPLYDSDNPKHFLISARADWSHINDADKRFFYVKPNADYGMITITADGTSNSMRYISLYNGNDLHPAMLNKDEQANIRLFFNGAHYWVVDRMSSFNSDDFCYEITNNSSHIVLNRLYMKNFYGGIFLSGTDIAPYTTDNTIQNCRLDGMSPEGIDGDMVAIFLMGHTWNTPGRVKNTRVLNNEIRNANDGIMLIKMPQFEGNGTYWVDYPGTIIDYNHIYTDTAVYTDGNGNHDPNGKWALTENAVDLKGGSDDPEHPVVISNNNFWGYRRTDQNGGGSGSWGTALAAHYHVKNLVIKNNVIFNSNRGIAFSGLEGTPLTAEDVDISNNTLYDIGFNTDGNTGYNIIIIDAEDVSVVANTIVTNNKNSYWLEIGSEEGSIPKFVNISCNVIINSANEVGTRGAYNQVHDNYFYNTDPLEAGDGIYYAEAGLAKMTDSTFIMNRYTLSPDTLVLSGVVTTPESPHASGCFSSSLGTPTGPNPPDHTENVRANTHMEWLPVYGSKNYDIFFGTTTPPSLFTRQKANSFDPGVLKDTTTYYWQVVAMNDSDTIAGAIWQFRTSINGVNLQNLALHMPVTCSSQENEAHRVENIVDSIVGVSENRWSAGPMPQWAEVDLGKNDTLIKTELICYFDRAYRFTVTCREEGDTAYKMIVDRQNNTQRGAVENPITDFFSKTLARYIRLTVFGADTTTYNGTWASISEFRVFGKEGISTFVPQPKTRETGFFVRNYPNPFNNATTISFHLPKPGEVTIRIYDVTGKEIATIPRNQYSAGTHTTTWKPGNYHNNGIYYYHIRYNNQIRSGKMILSK